MPVKPLKCAREASGFLPVALQKILPAMLLTAALAAQAGAQEARHHVEMFDVDGALELVGPFGAKTVVMPKPAPTEASSFVNWESPHVHPLELTPNGELLLAVNTADNRLEVFEVDPQGLVPLGAIPVGLDPISVRARTDDEAWVVNRISDSVSVVDLQDFSVRATVSTGNEPADVVFAGTPLRAFVSVSQANEVHVFDPADLSTPAVVLPIEGEQPRAMATDGSRVFVAIFDSGNRTTLVPFFRVKSSAYNPYPGDPAPPPNSGADFSPPMAPNLPPAPETSLIVKRTAQGWLDDNGGDWSGAVGWKLVDHDIAIIDTEQLSLDYVSGVMNHDMALALDDLGEKLFVVGTDAINHVRFEPNLNGIFVRVKGAMIPTDGSFGVLTDLNPHLDYSTPTIPQAQRDLSIGDPRGVAWSADGELRYVTGMGSNNVIAVGAPEVARVEVGEGPTGIVRNAEGDRLYVLNRFDASISVLGTAPFTELFRHEFFDPTPSVIRLGRPFLYDTHLTSGLGQVSCASCHVDGRVDQLAWDLGDPSGGIGTVPDEFCLPSSVPGIDGCYPHPMKGPMTTQTLVGALTVAGPLHWRGDRDGLGEFNPAFESLLGDDEQLSPADMKTFIAYGETLTQSPNPYRLLDGSLDTTHPNGGDPTVGADAFHNTLSCPATDPVFSCNACHSVPQTTSGGVMGFEAFTGQPMKMAHLKATYRKQGFDRSSSTNTRGFGIFHDGVGESVAADLTDNFPNDPQLQLDVEAYVNSIGTDTHAGIGQQVTVDGTDAAAVALSQTYLDVAGQPSVGLVVKGLVEGEPRGFYLDGGLFRSDRVGELWTVPQLASAASVDEPLTHTLVPAASAVRIGVDRDEDGFFDRDELDAGSDPADASSTPADCLPGASTDLGSGWPGTGGQLPKFFTCGLLSSSSTADIILSNALPNAPAALVVSLQMGQLPFPGGAVLVPNPEFILGPVITDDEGRIEFPDQLGTFGPIDLYAQWVIQDPGAFNQLAFSNALIVHVQQ